MINNTYTQQVKPKNNLIQIFRAFAIIAVVMIHTTPSGEYQVLCRPFINFSVATFLFLSGYLTNANNENWFIFCKKRIIRVIVPYIIWSIIYSLPTILHIGIESLFKNLITARACGTLYYIYVYIQFVLLTPFLCKLARSKYRYIGWIIAPISILIFQYYRLLTGIEYNEYVTLIWADSCLGWFSFYYIGLLLGNRIIEKNYSLKILTILYVISIFIQIAEGYGWFLLGEKNCGTQLKFTALLTSILFILIIYTILQRKSINIKNKFLRILGDYSFGIYLCHIMVLQILKYIPYYKMIPYPITSIIVLFASLAMCHIGHKVFGPKISCWFGLK